MPTTCFLLDKAKITQRLVRSQARPFQIAEVEVDKPVSLEGTGVPLNPRAMLGEGRKLFPTEWPGRVEYAQVIVEFRSRLGRRERDRDCWVLEYEAVPLRRARDRESRRVVGRRLQQRAPAQRGVGD